MSDLVGNPKVSVSRDGPHILSPAFEKFESYTVVTELKCSIMNSVRIKNHLFMSGLPKVTAIMFSLDLDLWNEALHVTYEII